MDSERIKGTLAAIKASAVLFAAVFVLLGVQMLLGNDPAIGTTREATTKAAVTQEQPDDESFLDMATDALDIQSPPDDQYYQQSQEAPAPVQSSSS